MQCTSADKELHVNSQPQKYYTTISISISIHKPEIKCHFSLIKPSTQYSSFNALYSRSKACNSELLSVELVKSFCLPVLLDEIEVTDPSKSALTVLNNLISRAVYRIFARDSIYAKRAYAIAIPSVCLSVCPSVRLSVCLSHG